MRSFFLTVVFLVFTIVLSFQSYAQSMALPFLLISSSTRANGMGEADVADHTDDPFAPIANPAHLGSISRTSFLTSGYDHSDWLPGFQLPDLKYSVHAVNAGIDLRQLNPDAPALTVGIGYSNIHLDLGMFVQTAENSPIQIGTFDAWEKSDQYSFGLGYDNWVRISAGMTVKYVRSRLSIGGPGLSLGSGEGKATLYDYGFLLDVPLLDIASRIAQKPFTLEQGLFPYADWSIGIARNNLGKESITYIDQNQKDPLPRYARAGMGIDLGLALKNDRVTWKPCSVKWTVEAADILVDTNPLSGQFTYQGGLGDIAFFKEVIMGKTNIKTEKKKGWEVNFMEIIAIRGGRFEEDESMGNRRLSTTGWGFRFAGIAKMFRALYEPRGDNKIVRYMVDHMDVRYDHSEWTPDDSMSPLVGTKFDSIGLSILM